MATNINRQPNLDEIRELLSPYLDGEVTEEERLWVEQAIATSTDLQQELESLRQMVGLLAAMPSMAAPRPFTLSEADVQPVSPPAQKRSFWGSKWFSSLAMTAAALACVVITGWVLFVGQFNQSAAPQEVALSSQAESAPAAPTLAQAVPEVEQEAASAAREEASAAEAVVVEEEAAATEADEQATANQPEIAIAPPPAGAGGETAAGQPAEEMAAAPAVEEAVEEEAPAEEEMAAAGMAEEAVEAQEAPASEGREEITTTQDTAERMTADASPTPEVAALSQSAPVLPTELPQPEEAADAAAAEVAPSLKSASEATEAAPEAEEPAQLMIEPEATPKEAIQAYSAEQATATLAPAPTATSQPSPTTISAPAAPTIAPTAGVDDQVAETESATGLISWLIAGVVLLALLVLGAIIWSKLGKR